MERNITSEYSKSDIEVLVSKSLCYKWHYYSSDTSKETTKSKRSGTNMRGIY